MKSQTALEASQPADLPINLAMLAHDIKSPVNQVNGLLELALMQSQENGELQQILQMAVKANRNLSQQVNNLLDGGFPAQDHINQSVKVNFNELIASCMDAIKSLPGFSKTTFITNMQVTDGWVVSKTLLHSVVQNLLENAVKYRRQSVDRNIVICSTHASAENLIIKISDNGRGIDPSSLKSIFNKADRNHEQTIEGHGMGLYLAKSAVHKLEGQIKVESQPGEGTTFTITLPNKL